MSKQAGAVTTIVIVLAAVNSAKEPACVGEQFACPEPESHLADNREPGRPTGPSTASRLVAMGPTGPGPRAIFGSGALVAGSATLVAEPGRFGLSGGEVDMRGPVGPMFGAGYPS